MEVWRRDGVVAGVLRGDEIVVERREMGGIEGG
jgi:hypothetical protein